jgi:hypothetical protein
MIRFLATKKQFDQLMSDAKKQIRQKRYNQNGQELNNAA